MEQLSFFDEERAHYKVDDFSAGGLCNDTKRVELENHYFDYVEITDKFNRQTVSFQKNKNNIVHRWLKYKEGFSSELVKNLLTEMNLEKNALIMDPFMGSGTTAFVCQTMNYDCVGYDILPISKLAIEVKTNAYNYDINELNDLIKNIKSLNVPDDYTGKVPFISITEGAYPEETDRYLAYITQWMENSNYSTETKKLFKLGILNSLEDVSYTSKSGQYLSWDCRAPKIINYNEQRKMQGKKELPQKKVRKIIKSPRDTIFEELEKIVEDIKILQQSNNNITGSHIDFRQNSVLFELPVMADNTISGVITSPPYCNRYDYTRTYALELAYLGVNDKEIKSLRQTLLSCTVESKSKSSLIKEYYKKINQEERYTQIDNIIKNDAVLQEISVALNKRKQNGDLNNNGVVRMVDGYFTELGFIYAELYRVCRKGAIVAFVNDNVRYGGEVIPVDFISTSLAEKMGFKVKKIYVLKQQKGNSSQQMARYGRVPLRKSITLWYK